MLKMRLQRIGRKNDPSFRVVVTDSHNGPKAGNHVDIIGSYNPKMNTIQIDGEAAKKWIAQGVQVSDTVHNLLVSEKVIEGAKKNVLPKKSPIIDEEKLKAEEEAKAAAQAAKEAEAEAPATDEAPAEESETASEDEEKEETKDDALAEEPKEEAPAEEAKEEVREESATEETPAEEEEKKD